MSDEDRRHLRADETSEPCEVSVLHPNHSKAKRCLCISSTIFLILLLLAAVVVLMLLLVMVGHQPKRVQTTCGLVEGKYDHIHKVFSFKGIPFAAPPTGKRRWLPPESLNNSTCWKNVYYANEFSPMCLQLGNNNKPQGSEDCLYLNVFTPSVDTGLPLPVMVYIHGGYLLFGDGSTPGYSPDERLTNDLQMVFVSIQYRLNAFGFLVSSALPGRRGNYGFLDQIQALTWVKENIGAFGGDPNQVTIFGQSSGGTSVWALMMSPLAKGLFHRAWMLSPSAVLNKTLGDAVQDNEWLLEEAGLNQACGGNVTKKCLLNVSGAEILSAISEKWNVVPDSNDLPTKGYFEPAFAIVDGYVIPADPFEMWQNRNSSLYSDVPVIIGSTAQEIDLNPTPKRPLKSWTEYQLTNYITDHLDPFGHNISQIALTMYPWQVDAEYVFTTLTSDLRCICSVNEMSRRAATALTSNVYRYIVTSFPSRPAEAFGSRFYSKYAFHSWDSFAFFWGFDELFQGAAYSRSDEYFGRTVQQEMGNFARMGVPLSTGWLPYPNTTALLDEEIQFTEAYHEEHCKFWMSNGFFSYSWIN